MKKVVTFGEIMLRLAPQGFLRFTQHSCGLLGVATTPQPRSWLLLVHRSTARTTMGAQH